MILGGCEYWLTCSCSTPTKFNAINLTCKQEYNSEYKKHLSLILKSPLPHSQNPCLIPRSPCLIPRYLCAIPRPPCLTPRSKALFPEPWPHSKISPPCAQGSGHAVCNICVMMPAVLCQSISDWMTSALSKGSTSTHLHPPPTQKKRVAKQPTKPEPVSHKHETTPLTAGKEPFSRDSNRGVGYLNSTGVSRYELASFPTK